MFNFLNRMHIIQDEKEELMDYIKEGAQLIDVRTREEFEAGHAEGSVNIPMQQIPMELDNLDKSRKIIVFCRSGNRSDLVKEFLLNHGFDSVKNGGAWQNMHEWVKKYKSS